MYNHITERLVFEIARWSGTLWVWLSTTRTTTPSLASVVVRIGGPLHIIAFFNALLGWIQRLLLVLVIL